MQINFSQLIIGIIFGCIIGFFLGKQNSANILPVVQPTNQNTNVNQVNQNKPTNNQVHSGTNVPQKAIEVLNFIKANHHAMPGYVGGRIFTNRENNLPAADDNGQTMQYQEWDVNPKIEGQNRGTERLITSKNGRAWYTNNHYQSFIEIK